MLSPARRLAHRVLVRVRERDSYAPQALDAALSDDPLPDSDAALAHRLVYGTLQMQATLDVAIDRVATDPVGIEPRVRDALRLSAYEALFGDTPAHAVVDQGVELVKSVRPRAAPLANAVLRRIVADAAGFPWGDPADPAVLAVQTGHPRWLVEMWLAELGPRVAAKVLAADNTPAPLYVASNPFKTTFPELVERLRREGAEPSAGPLASSIACGDPSAAVRSGAVRDGHAIVVDAAAQVAPLALGAHPGGLVIDMAAGRGTKSVLIQAMSLAAGAAATIYAIDIHPFKTRVLAERMGRLAVPGVVSLQGDATDTTSVKGLPSGLVADAVLVDAPCTGLGTLRRHPEKRWRIDPSDGPRLASLGGRLLAEACRLVRPGGVVVYSTCSVSRVENGDVVTSFLEGASGSDFRVRRLDGAVPDGWRGAVTAEGWFQSLPSEGGPDGHFVAALERIA